MTTSNHGLPLLKIISLAVLVFTLILLGISFILRIQTMDANELFEFYIRPGNEVVTLVLAIMAVSAGLLSVIIPKFLDKTPVDPIYPHAVIESIVFAVDLETIFSKEMKSI